MHKTEESYREEDLVYLNVPQASSLQMVTAKLRQDSVGTLIIVLDSVLLKLPDLEKTILADVKTSEVVRSDHQFIEG